MKFEIDFNNENNDKLLEELGCVYEDYEPQPKYGPFGSYKKEMASFEELEIMLEELNKKTKRMFSAIVSFDPPCIFFDDEC